MKLILPILAGLLMAISFAQTTVKNVTIRTLSNDSQWRTGVAIPILPIKDHNKREIGTLDFWSLTETDNVRITFAGFGVDYPIYRTKDTIFGFTAGYSTRVGDLQKLSQGRWGVGFTVRVSF